MVAGMSLTKVCCAWPAAKGAQASMLSLLVWCTLRSTVTKLDVRGNRLQIADMQRFRRLR
jgi:hypothetical protein